MPDLRVLDGVASWCGGLHGAMSLGDALKALSKGLGASASAISRHYHRTEPRPRLVALYPGAASRPLVRAFCDEVLGDQFGHARSGSIWFLSEMRDDPAWRASDDLADFLSIGGSADIAVIPVSSAPNMVDYFEFHFSGPLERSQRLDFEALVPTIVRSWAGRKPGLVSGTAVGDRLLIARPAARDRRPALDAAILGVSNPCNLSRAEFRVCLLLSHGLSVKAVTDKLGLSENTVRSHLRAIYSKTDTSSLPELIYRILSATPEDDVAAYGASRA